MSILTKKLTPEQIAARQRIEEARGNLISRGYHCLSGGKWGLPSYTDIEAWGKAGVVLYLIYDTKTGGWDILQQIDATNDIAATWREVDKIDFVGIPANTSGTLAALKWLLEDSPYTSDATDCECGEHDEKGSCCHTAAHQAIAEAEKANQR